MMIVITMHKYDKDTEDEDNGDEKDREENSKMMAR